MVKGAALFLQQGSSPQGQRSLQHPHKHAGDGSKLMLLPRDLFSVQQRNPPLLGVSTLLVFKAREIAEHRFIMTGAGKYSFLFLFILFIFWLYLQHVKVPGPGIELVPQQQPKLQQ